MGFLQLVQLSIKTGSICSVHLLIIYIFTECAMEISEEDLKTFQDCEVFAEKMTRTQKLNKGLIYAGIIAGIFVLCILVYIIYQKTNRIKPRLNQKSTVNLL